MAAPCLDGEGFPGVFVTDGENGLLHDGTAEAIREVVERFEREGIDGDPRDHVAEFDTDAFQSQARSQISRWYDEFRLC